MDDGAFLDNRSVQPRYTKLPQGAGLQKCQCRTSLARTNLRRYLQFREHISPLLIMSTLSRQHNTINNSGGPIDHDRTQLLRTRLDSHVFPRVQNCITLDSIDLKDGPRVPKPFFWSQTDLASGLQ